MSAGLISNLDVLHDSLTQYLTIPIIVFPAHMHMEDEMVRLGNLQNLRNRPTGLIF